ncbi:DUF4136 domain-containing protein [Sphingomonas flavalba]|uniref:DUF4136 domain-containing protein n=1 Tax=Sphingomonas flavalba TaxID=2559804 RepID=UPI0039E0FAD4
MRSFRSLLPLLPLVALGACATGPSPIDTTRFHLNQALERGSAMVEPVAGGDADSLEFRTYADAVQRELQRVGYVPAERLGTSLYVAVLSIERDSREGPPRRSPVSIGLGGGTGGYRGGVGGGISFGLGKKGSDVIVGTRLTVQLKRRADQTVVWEGRAETTAQEGAADAQPATTAARLAEALFRDFPGESGRTIRVK